MTLRRLTSAEAPERPGTTPEDWEVTSKYHDDGTHITTTKRRKGAVIPGEIDYPPVTTSPGVLTSVAVPAARSKDVWIEGDEHFSKAALNSGTVNPHARVVRVRFGRVTLAAALDSDKPDSPDLDVLRLDLTGRGEFASALVLRSYAVRECHVHKKITYYFAKRPLELTVAGRRIVGDFTCSYTEQRRADGEVSRSACFKIGTGAQGACRFGQKVYNLRLTDWNHNLLVNDPMEPVPGGTERHGAGDWFFLDIGDGRLNERNLERRLGWSLLWGVYGHPVLVDGRLHELTVSDDGTKVQARPYAGPTGMVRVNHPAWRACFYSDQVKMALRGGTEPVPLPPGRYRVADYKEWSSVPGPKGWEHLCFPRNGEGPVAQVTAGKVTNVEIGSPVTTRLRVTIEGRIVRFRLEYFDVGEHRISYFGESQGAFKDRVEIQDEFGRTVDAVSINRHDDSAAWNAPKGLVGTFTATTPEEIGPFRAKVEKTTFMIGKP